MTTLVWITALFLGMSVAFLLGFAVGHIIAEKQVGERIGVPLKTLLDIRSRLKVAQSKEGQRPTVQ